MFRAFQICGNLLQWPQETDTTLQCPVRQGSGKLTHSNRNSPAVLELKFQLTDLQAEVADILPGAYPLAHRPKV